MSNENTASSTLFKALERAIKPLIRLMLSRGITYPQFTDWLKQVFIQVALTELNQEEKSPSDSRISVFTGVHRKDVKRLRESLDQSKKIEIPQNIHAGTQLVTLWLNTPEFSEFNSAKPIYRLRKLGGEISFEALSEKVTKDVRARSLLDEMLRLGIVSVDADDKVHLINPGFIPSKGEEEKTFYLGLGVGDHSTAAVHNVLGQSPSFFDRILHYEHLSSEHAEKIEKMAREQSNSLLQSINAEADSLSKIANTSESRKRISLGIYFYSEDQEDEAK